jgi:hypothetical protein
MTYFLNAGAWSLWATFLTLLGFSILEAVRNNGIPPDICRCLSRFILPALAVGAAFQWARAAAWVVVSFAGQQTPFGRWVTAWGWVGVTATAIAGFFGLMCALRWRRRHLAKKALLRREADRLTMQ